MQAPCGDILDHTEAGSGVIVDEVDDVDVDGPSHIRKIGIMKNVIKVILKNVLT